MTIALCELLRHAVAQMDYRIIVFPPSYANYLNVSHTISFRKRLVRTEVLPALLNIIVLLD